MVLLLDSRVLLWLLLLDGGVLLWLLLDGDASL